MDLAIGVAIGSSMQIALLVTPFLVILGWILDEPMSLQFEIFETVVFFLAVLVTNYLISDGKSNYLEGAMLLGMYIIIGMRSPITRRLIKSTDTLQRSHSTSIPTTLGILSALCFLWCLSKEAEMGRWISLAFLYYPSGYHYCE